MKAKRKATATVNKDIHSENWCFVCKDGGDLRICDHKKCLKSYHPGCVGKEKEEEEAFLESESKWDCDWHRCFNCGTSSYLHCYTCSKAVCRHCLPDGEILQIKGKYGLCKLCLKLALLFEEKKNCDSDGRKVDFTDLNTLEGLYMEYYVIIKKKEMFEMADITAAKERASANKNCQPESGSEDYDEEDEKQVSDYDDSEDEKSKHQKKGKRSGGRNPARQTPMRPKKKEFIGWASRSLVEFLHSIGKSSAEELSQRDVTAIVHGYAKENKLWCPGKRKMIMCDAPLLSLFGKKIINRSRVYDYLEEHFSENQSESEEDEVKYDSHDLKDSSPVDNLNPRKRQRNMDVEKTKRGKDSDNNVVPIESRFAAIVVENVKLVYLKRSVLKEMLKEPDLFEDKVAECIVRVKSDPYDYMSKYSHQLRQVKGAKTVSTSEHNTETVLLFSVMPTEISISLISDEDFSQGEFEDFKEKVVAGQIQRPTVEDLQQKAKSLHKDMTNVCIRKELALLQNLIDRANEKGWRRELYEYLDRRKTLQSPAEQARLLENVPEVIPEPDLYEPAPDSDSEVVKNGEKSEPNPHCDSELQDKKESEDNSEKPSPLGIKQPVSEKSTSVEPQPVSEVKKSIEVIDILSDDEEVDPENEVWCIKDPDGERNKGPLCVLRRWSENSKYASEFVVWKESGREEDAIPLMEAVASLTRGR